MRFAPPAAVLIAGLLAAASASADNAAGPTAAPPPAAAPPPVAALPAATPAAPAAPLAPAYPAPMAYAPGYPPPYMMYPPPGAGAPPPYWTPIAPPTERRSNAMRTTGIVLFAAGGVMTAVGGAIFTAVATTRCVDEVIPLNDVRPEPAPAAAHERVRSAHQALNGCDTSPGVGLGIITAGLVTAVVGIPLFVIGSKQVPARTMTGKLVPELNVGAGNGSLRWTF
jgi:hypothetical protein